MFTTNNNLVKALNGQLLATEWLSEDCEEHTKFRAHTLKVAHLAETKITYHDRMNVQWFEFRAIFC